MPTATRLASILCIAFTFPLACAPGTAGPRGGGDGDVVPNGDGDLPLGDGDIFGGDGDILGDGDISMEPPTANCGDGVLDDDEACDDANLVGGDGCGANCRFVEPGWVCPEEGQPCRAFAKCGDGAVIFPEQCDDGALAPGDGCSDTCKVEIGFKCDGSPSVCSPTTCGDGAQEGSETCEDGNSVPFDGCNGICQAEPVCTESGCTSSCGDGLIIGDEQCDDGNAIDGDGCSSTCQEEPGYVCTQAPVCPDGAADCPINLPIVIRDFNVSQPDFHPADANPDVRPCDGFAEGIASAVLDANGKPSFVAAPAHACTDAEGFGKWYVESDDSSTIVSSITLFPNGANGYVNRIGENGEPYYGRATGNGRWCGNTDNTEGYDGCEEATAANQCNGGGFDPAVDTCWEIGATRPANVPDNCCTNCWCAGNVNQAQYDGNPLFFPIDDHPDALMDTRTPAKIPAQIYEGLGWPWENPADVNDQGVPGPAQPLHNFHFTSEIAYWFEYQEGLNAEFSFVGDDDVFVYLNRRLLLDLGGIHVPLAGRFTIGADGSVTTRTWQPEDPGVDDDMEVTLAMQATTAADLGMTSGNVYEIKVFHAERKPEGSSFQLTLSGFNTARSDCVAICGDGILASGEQCDLGEAENVGGHNGCNPDCTLGSYCGDGIVQEDVEQCDDNAPDAPADCSGCRLITIR